ncbi:retrovirus-related pol polyprotein from transposon TNT 1-94 [Tanacetum coccineum]|uniref:Retrovirus-related pol polyprotein from transposon TNT 1-94 n=1 Tax=Tanacetum coccineum TaxID=301880 RepID=A0ABQ4YCT1_9ASTR
MQFKIRVFRMLEIRMGLLLPGIVNQNANQNGNGNVVAARAEGNGNGNNGNQIRCYNCIGMGHLARNCTVRPRIRDAAYLQTQLLIAQKEEAWIQLQAKEFDLMTAAWYLDEIKNGSAEVHHYDSCYNNDIFNMFTQEEQYTEILDPIIEPHMIQQNNSNVISVESSVEHNGGTVEQHPATVEETLLLEKHDPPAMYDSEETLQLAQESRLKMKQLNKEIKPANYAKINQLSEVFVSQKAKSRKELYFSNTSKTASVSKSISITNEEFSDDTSLKAAKFVRDFKSLAKETDESLSKHKALEYKIERLLRAVVSQDIMSIVQNPIVVETSDLQTKLKHTKERFENCVIKKENEYAKLWNDWYKKCEECKYDIISYGKAYTDMQQKIKRLQAQLGDLKGKNKDTPCVSDTLDPLSQKLENENMELEFQVLNYAK